MWLIDNLIIESANKHIEYPTYPSFKVMVPSINKYNGISNIAIAFLKCLFIVYCSLRPTRASGSTTACSLPRGFLRVAVILQISLTRHSIDILLFHPFLLE